MTRSHREPMAVRPRPKNVRILRLVPLALILLLCGCDSAAPGSVAESSSKTTSASPNGTVLLRLEKINGVLVEGFKLSVRLEAPPGHSVLTSTWMDLVHDLSPQPKITDWYDSVVRTSVPAGPFVFTTVMHPGMENEQPPCITRGQVQPGGVATVTVKFSDRGGCSTVSGGKASESPATASGGSS
jgi:hypothetical protein